MTPSTNIGCLAARDLGGGLVLRRSTPADADRLSEFNARLHGDQQTGEPEEGVRAWTRDLLERPHPTFRPDDFTIVEEGATGRIVSTMNLISQRWSYEGIEFGVGRPEIVGTDPDYRGRGLIRAQFEVIHQMSAERGEVLQGITGIPYFYRQFGYEMALALDSGRAGFAPQVPALDEGRSEPFHLRPATECDLPHLARLYEQGARRSMVSCVHDEATWRYMLCGRTARSVQAEAFRVVETPDGRAVGLLVHAARLWGSTIGATRLELDEGTSYAAVMPSVIRYLWATGQEYASATRGAKCDSFRLSLGPEHPAYAAASGRLPGPDHPYAWYIRIPNVPGFVSVLTPVLERRLAESALAGHTGELCMGFYRSGLKLAFSDGRLSAVTAWQPHADAWGDAAFPGLTFLQLLMGYRSLDELRHAFADCFANTNHADVLLPILFPKRPSHVWPLG